MILGMELGVRSLFLSMVSNCGHGRGGSMVPISGGTLLVCLGDPCAAVGYF